MKKAFFSLIFIMIVYIGFAQNIIDEAISVLENPVPTNFVYLGQDEIRFGVFVNNNFYDGNLVVLTRESDNVVIISSIGAVFETEDEANRWVEQFHKIIENQGWKFESKHYENELYVRNGIFLSITPISQREYIDIIKYKVRINISKWLLGLLTITILY